MKIITRDEVAALLTPAILIEAMRGAFLALHRGEVAAPDEFHLRHPNSGDVHIKGAHLHGSEWMVAKVATADFVVTGNHGCVLGISATNGAIEWLVDDQGLLTELRTAAAVALTVDLLARNDASSLSIIGSGVQAGFQWEAVRTIRNFVDIRVASRNALNAQTFADQNGLRACATVEDALDGADVVLLTTTSRSPVLLDLSRLAAGCHVTASGADMMGKIEVGPEVLREADLIVVDDRDLACRVGLLQSGSTIEPVTVGSVVAGGVGRRHAGDRTVCGLVGLGVQDAAAFSALLFHYNAANR